MTNTDFDALLSDALDKGQELADSRHNRSTGPRKTTLGMLVKADLLAHPEATMVDTVRRVLLAAEMDALPTCLEDEAFADLAETIFRVSQTYQRVSRQARAKAATA